MNRQAGREELIGEMRRIGIRVTAQRIAVAEVLTHSDDHPTALEVYERVQERFPHITMGTVYNTVSTLAMNGLIQTLPFAEGARYEANAEPHANLVCTRCGTIIDARDEEGMVDRLRDKVAKDSSFRVISQRVDFYGVCQKCAAKPAGKRSARSRA